MCIDEYNAEIEKEQAREEGEAKGRKEGEAKGRKEGEAKGRKEGEAKGRLLEMIRILTRQVRKGRDLGAAADLLDLPEEELRPVYEAVSSCAPDYAEERILSLLMPEGAGDR